MGEYAAAVDAFNLACDTIRALERAGAPVPERFYDRLQLRYQQAAAAEVAHKAARQGALWGEGIGRRYSE